MPKKSAKDQSTFRVKRNELSDFVKKSFKEGNIRRIIIKDMKGKKYAEIPVTVGVIGFLVAPILFAILALAAMVDMFEVEIVRKK